MAIGYLVVRSCDRKSLAAHPDGSEQETGWLQGTNDDKSAQRQVQREGEILHVFTPLDVRSMISRSQRVRSGFLLHQILWRRNASMILQLCEEVTRMKDGLVLVLRTRTDSRRDQEPQCGDTATIRTMIALIQWSQPAKPMFTPLCTHSSHNLHQPATQTYRTDNNHKATSLAAPQHHLNALYINVAAVNFGIGPQMTLGKSEIK